MNVVGKALPFHMICDCGTKPLPLTVSRTDVAPPGTAPGESEIIWGCGTELSQLLKSTIALQVVQPANSRVRAAIQAMRTAGKGVQELTRQERIPASRLRAFLIVTVATAPRSEHPSVLSSRSKSRS